MEIILYRISLIYSIVHISMNTKDKHENWSYLQRLTHETAFKLRYKSSINALWLQKKDLIR
jgi:hypothetical protein